MRKTKIICTIGPASEREDVLVKMCKAGMDVARLNFSHGSHPEHQAKIDLIKKVRADLELPIAIMLDTKGPEYRIGTFVNGKAELAEGGAFTFTVDDVEGNDERVSVSYKNLPNELNAGDRILVNNGLLIFEVEEIKGGDIVCDIIAGGTISDRKSMNFPNHVMTGPYLSDTDKADILFGIENDVDFIAASFVSNQEDVKSLRDFLNENGGSDIDIVAKIENRAGVENIDDICEYAEGIMVARGDLGVEIPFVEVPSIQKELIAKCRMRGKRVITATEMLESMVHNPRPTRAEISDVANAVYDGSSAIMLSGESAAGKYPVESVKNMADIAEYTEKTIDYARIFKTMDYSIEGKSDAITHSACSMAIDIDAKAIVISSQSGMTARMVSRFRCPVDIIGLTSSEKVWRKLNLSWGVKPVMGEQHDSMDVRFFEGTRIAAECFDLSAGDNVILTGGQISGASGNTNTIRLETVKHR